MRTRQKDPKTSGGVEVMNQSNHTVRLSISPSQMTTPLLFPFDTSKKALNPIASNIHVL